MKGRCRVFKVGALHHIYQRTVEGFLIFYSIKDFLVFFTLFSTVARRYDIKVLGLCLMYDHIHTLAVAESCVTMSSFVREYTGRFSRQRNKHYGNKGQFFVHRFGSAPKTGDKKARTAISYLYNNPVEKKICPRAEQFQWSFLSYAHNRHPFSPPLKLNSASNRLRKAAAEINIQRKSDKPLSYEFIERISNGLTKAETMQLTDYIITQYNCVDYGALESYYDDYQTMLTAINSNTGSEYQIKEEVTPGSDTVFKKMSYVLRKMCGYKDMTQVLSLSGSDKMRLAWILAAETGASHYQISKFLHIHRK